jgi:ribosomal-protein-alanine N-acetyltransferase
VERRNHLQINVVNISAFYELSKEIPNNQSIKILEAKKGDAKFYFASLTDAETIKHTSYNVKNISDIEKWFKDYKKQFKETKRISWAIEDTETKKVIGEISFFDVQVDHEKGEIGYFLAKEYWGQGIMSEILEKVMGYLFHDLRINRLQSIVVEENLGSRRLLEKNKFKQEGILHKYKLCRGKYFDFILYAKLAKG